MKSNGLLMSRQIRYNAANMLLKERIKSLNKWAINTLKPSCGYAVEFSYETTENCMTFTVYLNRAPIARGGYNACAKALTVHAHVMTNTFFLKGKDHE